LILLPEPVSFYIVIERTYNEQRELKKIKGVDTTLHTLNIEMEQDSPVEYVEWLDSPTVLREDDSESHSNKIGLDSISEKNESEIETSSYKSNFKS